MTNDVWFGVTPEPVAKYVFLFKFTSPLLFSLSFPEIESLKILIANTKAKSPNTSPKPRQRPNQSSSTPLVVLAAMPLLSRSQAAGSASSPLRRILTCLHVVNTMQKSMV